MTRSNGHPKIQIGVNPIIWSNDDFHDLGGSIPLEQCLAEMQTAGYAGTELGHKFPRHPARLRGLLERYDLQLVSGWHSLALLDQPFEKVKQGFLEHLEFLQQMGSTVVIVAECSRRVYHDPRQPLQFEGRQSLLTPEQWEQLSLQLDGLAEIAHGLGMRLAYHHHVGTLVQNEDEIDELMRRTQVIGLLVDTGHLAFAGLEPVRIIERHKDRIAHVHLKDVRSEVVAAVRTERASFADAVRRGVFTVPGDGSLDFTAVFGALHAMAYGGWLVVEAEQDPEKSPPLQYARMGRQFVESALGLEPSSSA